MVIVSACSSGVLVGTRKTQAWRNEQAIPVASRFPYRALDGGEAAEDVKLCGRESGDLDRTGERTSSVHGKPS